LDQRDRLGRLGHHRAPHEVAGQEPDDPLGELVAVHDQLASLAEQPAQLAVGLVEEAGDVLGLRHRPVAPAQAQLVVAVQVVRRARQRDHEVEPLLADPDDLLRATHLAVVAAEAAGALADRQLVLDDPVEVAWLDALCPLALGCHVVHLLRVRGPRDDPGPVGMVEDRQGASTRPPATAAARTVAATSCARTIAAPLRMAHTAVPTDPSNRSSRGAIPSRPAPTRASERPTSSPVNRFRLVPTSTSNPSATSTSRRARSCRLWVVVLPNPMPGSTHTSGTPASRAAVARSTRKRRTSSTTSP